MRTILTTLHSKFIHASLALPYLSAFCQEGCGEILVREFTVHEPAENVLASLLQEEPDVVAFSVYLWNRRETLELADALRAACPGIRVVLGGPEVSFEGPDLFTRHPGVTALIRGEGEIPLKALLAAWQVGKDPMSVPRLALRTAKGILEGPDGPVLDDLDRIPSPFVLHLVDLCRGFVYYESSRGCPYTCAFCMSALDSQVRSFSMERIRSDLGMLLEQEVPKIKFVDRTFNYNAARAREIFSFILQHNRGSHLHFEIGAHLLDEMTLELLETVPPGMFQFEIGVQSTLPQTLESIGRTSDLQRLEDCVRRLRRRGNIHLHLDLIAGLPGQGFDSFLCSIDQVAAMAPHHLQIEPVKLLPGSPLRQRADELGLRFSPHPPYTVLGTPTLSFHDIERLRGISRLLDLTVNSHRFERFLERLQKAAGSLSRSLERLESFWRKRDLFRHPLSQRSIFESVGEFIEDQFEGEVQDELLEALARDFAHSERVVPGKAPAFFDTALQNTEWDRVRERVRQETEPVRGRGIKIQHFAAAFKALPEKPGRAVLLFLYLTRTGEGMQVLEVQI